MEETLSADAAIITKYISVWGWHIIGIIFLVGGILSEHLVMMIALFILVGVCELMSLLRKLSLERDLNENDNR